MYKIVKKEQLAPKEFAMWVEAPRVATHSKPGQFVVLRPNEKGERIPLTVSDMKPEQGLIRIIFQVVGKTTEMLATFEEGESIKDVAGPLGTPSEIDNYGTVLLIGGGVGIAVLYPIIRAMKQAGNKVITILGGRNSDLVILKDECREYSDELIITTDDGSEGMKGLVTDAMTMLAERGEHIDRSWCIGPSVMMKFSTLTAKKYNWPITVSLNPLMVDGTGMCGCCRVTVDGKIFFACVDGPEFDGHKVDWTEFMNRLGQYRDEERISLEKYRYETGNGGNSLGD